MSEFSFIHAADLHLDSPFIGVANRVNADVEVVDALRTATFVAFENLIALCIDRQVDFLVVAGDIYDGADRSLQAQLRFRDGLARLDEAGIATYIAHGNHDPLDGWSHSLAFPISTHVFGARAESVVFHKHGTPVARIHGISYPASDIDEDFGQELVRSGDERFQIGVLHCNVGGNAQHGAYAPRSVADLADAGLDYWALGHVHETAVLRESDPFVGYPGNTQGRHIREQGRRGCFHVAVDGLGRMHSAPEFLETDAIRWLRGSLDIAGLDTMDELLAALAQQLTSFAGLADGRPVVVRLTLQGHGEVHRALVRANAAIDLLDTLQAMGAEREPFVWVEKIEMRTRPSIDIDSRRQAQDFVAELLTMVDELRESPQLLADAHNMLSELYEHRIAGKLMQAPDRAGVLALLDDVENRCIEMFEEEDG